VEVYKIAIYLHIEEIFGFPFEILKRRFASSVLCQPIHSRSLVSYRKVSHRITLSNNNERKGER
jgi:hypothetical protein